MNVKWAKVYGHLTKDRRADSHVIRDRRKGRQTAG
jgi:hypothetical protein